MVKLKLSFVDKTEVVKRVGRFPELQVPVKIEFKDEGEFIIPYFAYEVTLHSVPEYGIGFTGAQKDRISLGRFKYDKFVKTNDTELIFEFPLYPEVVEEMNKISAEDKYIAFKISVSDGLIYWIKSAFASTRGKYVVEGIDKITSFNVEMEYKGNTVGLISFSHEELAKLFSELEETEYEWLTVPIPKIEVEGVDEKIKEDIKEVIKRLKSARKVLHTPEYGQAMLDLRVIRDIISKKNSGGYTLKTELGKIVEEKTSKEIREGLNKTLRGAAEIFNKYIHEDRNKNELKETPPWRETKFAYSLMAYLCWYISNILKV